MVTQSLNTHKRAPLRPLQTGCLWSSLGLVAWLAVASPCLGQESRPGALLLKQTDRVIRGQIVARGEFYEVELAPNSRISIPKQNVAHVADSLEELYQIKRRSVAQWSVGDHYQLTRWCLLHDLLEHAAEHYAQTVQQAPEHPRVRQLGIELQERMLQDPQFRHYLGLPPLASPTPQATAAAALPAPAGSAATPSLAAGSTAGVPAATAAPQNSVELASVELATAPTAVAAYSAELVHAYTDRVQPILLNRCSQAACHGPGRPQLLRLGPPYSTAASRITAENLASVLRHVGSDSGERSPLLEFATRAHGIQPAAAIAASETRLLQELEKWISLVHSPVVPAVATAANAAQSQVRTAEQIALEPYATAVTLIPVDPAAPQLRQVPREAAAPGAPAASGAPATASSDRSPPPVAAGAFPLGASPPTAAEIDALEAQLKSLLGEGPASPPAAPRDPFDPAEFNRRFR